MNYRILPIAALLLVTVNCDHFAVPKSADPDEQVIDLPVKVKNTDGLTAPEADMIKRIAGRKAVSFSALTQAMIKKHGDAHQPKMAVGEIQTFVGKITPKAALSPAKTKIYYEGVIKAQNGQKDLIYNIDKSNVVDIYLENRMQCYSGTYLYELVRRQLGAKTFSAGNEVVIFQSGHVLPGYMVKEKAGFRLIGLETTQSGGARLDYGLAADLTGIRVVDAEMFAAVEVFADNMENPAEVTAAALATTAKRYGINPTSLPDTGDTTGLAATTETKRQLNQSWFAFGQPADTTPGDRERADSGDDGTRTDITPVQHGAAAVSVHVQDLNSEVLAKDCAPLQGHYVSLSGQSTAIDINVYSCDQITISGDPTTYLGTAGPSISRFVVQDLFSGPLSLIQDNGVATQVQVSQRGPRLSLMFLTLTAQFEFVRTGNAQAPSAPFSLGNVPPASSEDGP